MNKSGLRFSCCHRAERRKLQPNFSAWTPKSHHCQDVYQPLRSPTMGQPAFVVATSNSSKLHHTGKWGTFLADQFDFLRILSQLPVNWWHNAIVRVISQHNIQHLSKIGLPFAAKSFVFFFQAAECEQLLINKSCNRLLQYGCFTTLHYVSW